jgi:transposase-like protein
MYCGSERLVKAGLSVGGKQRYLCRGCGKRSSQDPNPRGVSAEKEAQILAALNERMSLRGVARTFGISRNTIAALLQKKTP